MENVAQGKTPPIKSFNLYKETAYMLFQPLRKQQDMNMMLMRFKGIKVHSKLSQELGSVLFSVWLGRHKICKLGAG